MRIILLALLALAACSSGESAVSDPHDGRIECRIGSARDFERFCRIESAASTAGPVLVVRKPDGGFRRLRITGDGRGVVAADGAEEAQVTIIADDRIEVAIGGDTFRLPATVRGQ
ncbi:MAG TPA: hypothetical protein VF704_05330 [Allosphingosinicella sp.]|jgi:hypothetical protein